MLLPPDRYISIVSEEEFEEQRDTFIDHMCYRALNTVDFLGFIVCDSLHDVEKVMENVKKKINDKDSDEDVTARSKKYVELSNGSRIEARPYSKRVKGLNTDYTLCAVREIRPIDIYTKYVATRAGYASVGKHLSSEQGKTVLLVPDTIEDVVADLVEQGSHTEI